MNTNSGVERVAAKLCRPVPKSYSLGRPFSIEDKTSGPVSLAGRKRQLRLPAPNSGSAEDELRHSGMLILGTNSSTQVVSFGDRIRSQNFGAS